MTSIINETTFQTSDTQPDHGFWVDGTVEVTLRGETRRVKAVRTKQDTIRAYGFTGRYETGSKAWPASVERVIDPRTGKAWDLISFGRDERQGRCKKTGHIHFA